MIIMIEFDDPHDLFFWRRVEGQKEEHGERKRERRFANLDSLILAAYEYILREK